MLSAFVPLATRMVSLSALLDSGSAGAQPAATGCVVVDADLAADAADAAMAAGAGLADGAAGDGAATEAASGRSSSGRRAIDSLGAPAASAAGSGSPRPRPCSE